MSLLLPRGSVEKSLLEALEDYSSQNLFACNQCGKCTASCPFSFAPQQVIRLLQIGDIERAIEVDTTWECAGCLTCATVCPKNLNPARVMRLLRTVRAGPLANLVQTGQLGDGQQYLSAAAQQYRAHSRSLRSMFFANIHRISRVASAMAPFSNWLLRAPGAGFAAHHLLGIHKARSLPPFASLSFPTWFRQHAPVGDGHRGTVLLFHDTFMDFDSPQVGISATELLEAAGYRVELSDTVCCGRPMISKGFLSRAAEQARINVERLYERTRQGTYVVGCEPSCLLTLRDEYPELLRKTNLKDKAAVVAQHSLLIDEFLAMLVERKELELSFRAPPADARPVLFHGHCQQKAFGSPAKTIALLNQAGYRAELVDAACCGMAGAFGYEVEHYYTSKSACERMLLPALDARPDADVAVMGISCRKQIEHFAAREASHVAEMLRRAIVVPGARA